MIGNIIKGISTKYIACEGMIHDKVLCMQTISMKQPGTIAPAQQMPIALDAYVVITAAGALHLVAPENITAIKIPELNQPAV